MSDRRWTGSAKMLTPSQTPITIHVSGQQFLKGPRGDLMGFSYKRALSLLISFLAAILTTSLSVPQANALSYSVRAATRVQTSGFGISDPHYLDDNTGDVQALSIASGPHTVTSTAANYATATAYSLTEL